MRSNAFVVILTTVLCCEISGADPVNKGPPTTMQYLRWLTEVQNPVDARRTLRRKIPEAKFDAVKFSDCIDWLRDLTASNLIVDANAIGAAGTKLSTAVTFTRSEIPFSDLLQLVLDQADPVHHRIQYAVQDEFVFVSTADGVRRLSDFERRCRPPSHDFGNVLNRRILTQRTPMEMVGEDGLDDYQSMQFRDTDVVPAVEAVSKHVGIPINVDWEGIGAARLGKESKFSFGFRNLTLFDALTIMLGEIYDLDRLAISNDGNAISVALAPVATRGQLSPGAR